MQLIFKNDYIDIFINIEDKLLYQKWGNEYPEFEYFKEAVDKTVAFFKEYQLEKLVSDTRFHPLASKKSTDYAASVVPQLIEYGMKKMAFIMSGSRITKNSIDNFMSSANSPVIKYFIDEKKAYIWLGNE